MGGMRWMVLVFMVGCGGGVEAPIADAGSPVDASGEAEARVVATYSQKPATEEAGSPDAGDCGCFGANFGTLICDGEQASDAMSCAVCGGHCNGN